MIDKIISIIRKLEGEGAKCILCGRRVLDISIEGDGIGICRACCDECTARYADTYYEVVGDISRLYAPFGYSGRLRSAILDMKFGASPAYAALLGKLVCTALPPSFKTGDYDILVPIPLHPKRYETRGYNQAGLLADEISKHTGIPVVNDALFRIRDTKHQMSLPAAMRIMNVMGAFFADAKTVCGKRILLIDDIYTVGATMRSCASELVSKGAAEVSGLVVAENFREVPKQGIKIPVLHRE